MDTQHTPGPWNIEKLTYITAASRDGNGFCLANTETFKSFKQISAREREANAKLIAAAPLLLRAVKDLLSCTELNLDDDNDNATQEFIEQAQFAVSKATGKA